MPWFAETSVALGEDEQWHSPLFHAFLDDAPHSTTGHISISERSLSDNLPPIGGVVHLPEVQPRSAIVWRLLDDRKVLEIRRIFLASAATRDQNAMEEGTVGDVDGQDGTIANARNSNRPVYLEAPASLLKTPSITLVPSESSAKYSLHIVLVTETGRFYRAIFQGPDFFYENGWRRREIKRYQIVALSTHRGDAAARQVKKPLMMQCPSLETVVIGCANGTLIKVTTPGELGDSDDDTYMADEPRRNVSGYEERELFEAGYLDKFKSAFTPKRWGFSPFKASQTPSAAPEVDNPRQPIALNSIGKWSFVLSRDRQLRIWNLEKGTKWKTINLAAECATIKPKVLRVPRTASQSTTLPLADSTSGHYIQVFDEQTYDVLQDFESSGTEFKLAIYLPRAEESEGCFALYEGRMDNFGELQELGLLGIEDLPGKPEPKQPERNEPLDDEASKDITTTEALVSAGLLGNEHLHDPKHPEPLDDESLVDFIIKEEVTAAEETRWSLWALWNAAPGPIARYAEIRQTGSAVYTYAGPTHWNNITNADGPNLIGPVFYEEVPASFAEVSEAYLDFIFHSRFVTEKAKRRALEQYRESTGGVFLDSSLNQSGSSLITLEDAVLFAVKRAYERTIKPARGAEKHEGRTEWHNYYRMCLEMYAQENAPTAIDCEASYGSLIITKRESLSVVREYDMSQILVHWLVSPLATSITMVRTEDEADFYQEFRGTGIGDHFSSTFQSIIALLKDEIPASRLLELDAAIQEIMPDIGPHIFDKDQAVPKMIEKLFEFPLTAEGPEVPEDFGDRGMPEQKPEEKKKRSEKQIFDEFVRWFNFLPSDFLGKLLDLLHGVDGDPAASSTLSQVPNTSAFTNRLLAKSFADAVNYKKELTRGVLLVSLLSKHVAKKNPGLQRHEISDQMVSRSIHAMCAAIVANWIGETTVTVGNTSPPEPQTDSHSMDFDLGRSHFGQSSQRHASPKAITGKMRNLTLSRASDAHELVEKPTMVEPLAFHLIQQHYMLDVDFNVGDYGQLLRDAVPRFLSRLGLLSKDFTFATSSEPMLKLVTKLVAFRHAEAARQLVNMLPGTPAVNYLKGRVSAELGDWEEADTCFAKAVFGSFDRTENWRKDAALKEVLPAGAVEEGIVGVYKHFMHLCRRGHHRGVVKYAKEALLCMSDFPEDQTEQVTQIWKEIFRSSLEIPDYGEALAAAVRNPDEQIKITCVRRLIGRMCETGDIKALCGFNVGRLQDEVEIELANKARTTPVEQCLSGGPNYYQIFYSYCVTHGDFRTAASAMYSYAQAINALTSRITGGGTGVSLLTALQQQCGAYLAVLNALSSVATEYAWIVVPVKDDKSKVSKRRKLDIPGDGKQPIKQQRITTKVLQPDDVRKEYLLCLTRLNLYNSSAALHQRTIVGLPSPEDALALYVDAGRHDDALSLGRIFELDLTKVFEAMAEKCAFLSTQPPDFNTNDSIGESLTDDPRVDWEGTSADRAWRTLNEYLLEHDTPRTGYAYRSAVIDRVLQVHRSFRIPKAWITSFYDTRNPDDLIRVYLKHDLLEEAAYFVSDYVKCQEKLLRARKTAGRPLDTASRPKWLPYLLIDQTIYELKKRGLTEVAENLANAVASYLRLITGESEEALGTKSAAKRTTNLTGKNVRFEPDVSERVPTKSQLPQKVFPTQPKHPLTQTPSQLFFEQPTEAAKPSAQQTATQPKKAPLAFGSPPTSIDDLDTTTVPMDTSEAADSSPPAAPRFSFGPQASKATPAFPTTKPAPFAFGSGPSASAPFAPTSSFAPSSQAPPAPSALMPAAPSFGSAFGLTAAPGQETRKAPPPSQITDVETGEQLPQSPVPAKRQKKVGVPTFGSASSLATDSGFTRAPTSSQTPASFPTSTFGSSPAPLFGSSASVSAQQSIAPAIGTPQPFAFSTGVPSVTAVPDKPKAPAAFSLANFGASQPPSAFGASKSADPPKLTQPPIFGGVSSSEPAVTKTATAPPPTFGAAFGSNSASSGGFSFTPAASQPAKASASTSTAGFGSSPALFGASAAAPASPFGAAQFGVFKPADDTARPAVSAAPVAFSSSPAVFGGGKLAETANGSIKTSPAAFTSTFGTAQFGGIKLADNTVNTSVSAPLGFGSTPALFGAATPAATAQDPFMTSRAASTSTLGTPQVGGFRPAEPTFGAVQGFGGFNLPGPARQTAFGVQASGAFTPAEPVDESSKNPGSADESASAPSLFGSAQPFRGFKIPQSIDQSANTPTSALSLFGSPQTLGSLKPPQSADAPAKSLNPAPPLFGTDQTSGGFKPPQTTEEPPKALVSTLGTTQASGGFKPLQAAEEAIKPFIPASAAAQIFGFKPPQAAEDPAKPSLPAFGAGQTSEAFKPAEAGEERPKTSIPAFGPFGGSKPATSVEELSESSTSTFGSFGGSKPAASAGDFSKTAASTFGSFGGYTPAASGEGQPKPSLPAFGSQGSKPAAVEEQSKIPAPASGTSQVFGGFKPIPDFSARIVPTSSFGGVQVGSTDSAVPSSPPTETRAEMHDDEGDSETATSDPVARSTPFGAGNSGLAQPSGMFFEPQSEEQSVPEPAAPNSAPPPRFGTSTGAPSTSAQSFGAENSASKNDVSESLRTVMTPAGVSEKALAEEAPGSDISAPASFTAPLETMAPPTGFQFKVPHPASRPSGIASAAPISVAFAGFGNQTVTPATSQTAASNAPGAFSGFGSGSTVAPASTGQVSYSPKFPAATPSSTGSGVGFGVSSQTQPSSSAPIAISSSFKPAETISGFEAAAPSTSKSEESLEDEDEYEDPPIPVSSASPTKGNALLFTKPLGFGTGFTFAPAPIPSPPNPCSSAASYLATPASSSTPRTSTTSVSGVTTSTPLAEAGTHPASMGFAPLSHASTVSAFASASDPELNRNSPRPIKVTKGFQAAALPGTASPLASRDGFGDASEAPVEPTPSATAPAFSFGFGSGIGAGPADSQAHTAHAASTPSFGFAAPQPKAASSPPQFTFGMSPAAATPKAGTSSGFSFGSTPLGSTPTSTTSQEAAFGTTVPPPKFSFAPTNNPAASSTPFTFTPSTSAASSSTPLTFNFAKPVTATEEDDNTASTSACPPAPVPASPPRYADHADAESEEVFVPVTRGKRGKRKSASPVKE